MRFLYSLIFYLATPLILLHFAWRGRNDREWLSRWRERFGRAPYPRPDRCIVIHAASVGEVNAAAPLIRSLLEKGDTSLLVTTFTPTGSQRLLSLFGDRVAHSYMPLDLPGACRRFLKSLSPRALVIMETEIWPNLYQSASALGIPVMITNAQISSRSFSHYQRFSGITRIALKDLHRVLAVGEEDAQRFITCGADPTRVAVTGNIKFDLQVPGAAREHGKKLRRAWGSDRPVVVAGSTHEADEAIILKAMATVFKSFPETLLVLAPRHPERFNAAKELIRNTGFRLCLFSESGSPDSSHQCLLLDVMGELQAAYGAADIAIIGGSFSNIGGHNPLEASMWGVPVLTGPDMSGQGEISTALMGRNAASSVQNPDELAAAMIELLGNTKLRHDMGAAGQAVIEENSGAMKYALKALEAIIKRAPVGARKSSD